MSKSSKIALNAVAALVFTAGLAGVAMADTTWEKNHPRRDEVNDRLANQNKRIHKEVKQGDLTKAQAAALHKDDHKIRQEERDMAHMDGGHVTKLDQKALNQQENAVSKDIGK
jgi:chromosome condensin MukBEF ATPase and DNA-binding subunit MukB